MTINLNDLLSNVSADALSDMADIQANKKTGGKAPTPFSDTEIAAIKGLVAACLVGHTSQRDVNKMYKEMNHKDTTVERKEQIKQRWFADIKPGRSASSFDKKFVELYQEIKEQVEA